MGSSEQLRIPYRGAEPRLTKRIITVLNPRGMGHERLAYRGGL